MGICKCLTDSPRSVPEANTRWRSVYSDSLHTSCCSVRSCVPGPLARCACFTTLGCGLPPVRPDTELRALGPLSAPSGEVSARRHWRPCCHQPRLASTSCFLPWLFLFFKDKTKWFCLETLLNFQKSNKTRTKQPLAVYLLLQTHCC